jgi:hypothetical protein
LALAGNPGQSILSEFQTICENQILAATGYAAANASVFSQKSCGHAVASEAAPHHFEDVLVQ